jgi:hypothetical protein
MDNLQNGSTPALTGSLLGALRAPFRLRTYRNLLYLFVQFPLGVAYFVALATAGGLAFGGVAAITEAVPTLLSEPGLPLVGRLIGLAVLVPVVLGLVTVGVVGLLVGGAALMTVHRALTALLLDRELPRSVSSVDPRERPLAYVRAFLLAPGSYLSTAVVAAVFPLGVALFVVLVVATTLSGVLLAAPLLYDDPRANLTVQLPDSLRFSLVDGFHTVDFGVALNAGAWTVDTLPEALVASAVGAVLLVVALNVFNGLAQLLGGLTGLLCRYARVFDVGP